MTLVLRRKAKDASSAEPPGRRQATRGSPGDLRLAATMLILLLVALLVATVGAAELLHEVLKRRATERARTDALAAAQSYVKDILSYDYRTMDHDLKAAQHGMTKPMAKSYGVYYNTILAPAAKKTKTIVQTKAQIGGVTQASPDRVEVVLFVKMLSVNVTRSTPEVDSARLTLKMKKVDGTWLVNGPHAKTTGRLPSARPSTTPSAGATKSPAPKGTSGSR